MLTLPLPHPPGDKYWVFKEVTAEPGYPHSLVELGRSLPREGIDTALRWEPVGKTYFFKGDQYWRYNEEKRTADPGYPKPITVWKGVPAGPQGAFISREGCECCTGLHTHVDRLTGWKHDANLAAVGQCVGGVKPHCQLRVAHGSELLRRCSEHLVKN